RKAGQRRSLHRNRARRRLPVHPRARPRFGRRRERRRPRAMKLGIRGKLFAGSFSLIILSLLASELYLRPAIEANLLARIRADLFARLALIVRAAGARTDLDRVGWDALADDIAPSAHGRVTFIDASGVVMGDSEVALADLERVENHRDRP